MKSWRENPDSEENQKATKQVEREIFALKMEKLHYKIIGNCSKCGYKLCALDSYCPNCEQIIEE